jgi:hypothetical protein
LATSFNSKLFGGTMAAARVQSMAWRGWFPSSQFGQINSPKRKTLRTSFSFFKLPLNFFDQRRKSKRSNSGKNLGRRPPGPTWAGRLGRPAHPVSGAGSVQFFAYRPYFASLAHGTKLAQ